METWHLTQENSERESMLPKVYETARWIGSDDKRFIRLSHLPGQQEIDNMLRVILDRTMQE